MGNMIFPLYAPFVKKMRPDRTHSRNTSPLSPSLLPSPFSLPPPPHTPPSVAYTSISSSSIPSAAEPWTIFQMIAPPPHTPPPTAYTSISSFQHPLGDGPLDDLPDDRHVMGAPDVREALPGETPYIRLPASNGLQDRPLHLIPEEVWDGGHQLLVGLVRGAVGPQGVIDPVVLPIELPPDIPDPLLQPLGRHLLGAKDRVAGVVPPPVVVDDASLELSLSWSGVLG